MEIIDKMISFMKKRDTSILFNSPFVIEKRELATVIIEILFWLQLEHKRKLWISEGRKTKHKPLELNFKYPWCNNLKMLLEKDEAFGHYFMIKDNKFSFSDSVTEEEKMEAWEKAYINHMESWQYREVKYRP